MESLDNPFAVEVYDKAFVFRGHIGDPISMTVTPRWNQVSTAIIEVDMDHRLAPILHLDGTRIVIKKDGEFIMSGKVYLRSGEGPTSIATLTIQVRSDFRLLSQVIAWPVPASALSAQSSEYYVATGNAETIVKNVVTANMITRLGMDVTCAANQNRGAVVPGGITFRFHTLYERLFPAIEAAGIGIDFRQVGTTIVCDVTVPAAYPFPLTEESGVLQSWSWSSSDPTATRVIAGGAGEGVARAFASAVDSALEADHNDVIEVFRDAREGTSGTLLGQRAAESLTEGAPLSGFAVRLSESDTFRYGRNGLVVGARVTVSVAGITRTDILREATMTYSRAGGVEVTPVVGEIQDNPDRTIANFLTRIKKSVSDLKVSK
jgi:hypothetical protein